MIPSNNHIHSIPNDISIYILNPFLDSASKFQLYTASKHLSSLIPLTTIDEFTYNRKTEKYPTPNIFKHRHNHTFKVNAITIYSAYNNLQLDIPSYVKDLFYVTDIPFPDISYSNVTKLVFAGDAIKITRSLKGLLPKTLEHLRLPDAFDQKLVPGDLPDTLEEFFMNSNYNHEIDPAVFPKSLKSLTFYYKQNIQTITPDFFPKDLKNLTIHWDPDTDEHIHINDQYYPSELITLKLDSNYSDTIDVALLPRSLKYLSVGGCMVKQFTKEMLPPNLKKFIIGDTALFTLDKSLFPTTLEDIQINLWNEHEITKDTFPEALKILHVGVGYDHLTIEFPEQLEELYLEGCNLKLKPGILPKTLQKLYFGDDWDHPLTKKTLPSSLKELYFGEKFTHSLSNALVHCTNLETLDLGIDFDQAIFPGMLPNSLKYLTFSSEYDQPLEINTLPENLHTLDMGESFDHPILPGVLPKSLRILELGECFNQELKDIALNEGLETLIINNDMDNHTIENQNLPASLRRIIYDNATLILRKK
jgi:hypothetical protein